MRGDVRSYVIGVLGIVFLALGIFSSDSAEWVRAVQILVGLVLIFAAFRQYGNWPR